MENSRFNALIFYYNISDDIICIDITAKNVTANSVSLHWTLRHIHHCKQYDLMKVFNNIVCGIFQHQL